MADTTFSDQRIAEMLGHDGMADVRRADHTNLSRQVVIKVLPDEVPHVAEGLAPFEAVVRRTEGNRPSWKHWSMEPATMGKPVIAMATRPRAFRVCYGCLFLAACLALCRTPFLSATPFAPQSLGGDQAQEVTIRASSTLVLVDLVAFDRTSGARLTGFVQDDFQLWDNGKPVSIATFDHTPRPIVLWFVMICNQLQWFDKGSTFFAGKTGVLRPALARLGPLDRVGVAHWCDDGKSMIDLPPTSNQETALAVIEEVLHRHPTVRPDCAPGTLALQQTIRMIADCTRKAVPRPTPVLVFVHGDAMGMSVRRARLITEELHEISAIVYGINNGAWPGGPTGIACTWVLDPNEEVQMELAHYWSQETGGRVFSTPDEAYGDSLKQLLEEAHARYQLGFVPERLDGKWHRLRVRMSDSAKRRHASVVLRYRSGYKAGPPVPVTPTLDRQPVDDTAPLSAAMKSAVLFTDVPFEATATGLPDRPQSSRITVAINPAALAWTTLRDEDRRSAVTVLIAHLTAGGETLDYEIKDLQVTRAKAQWARTPDHPVVLEFNVDSPPQAHRIRLVVRDLGTGRMGTRDLRRAGVP